MSDPEADSRSQSSAEGSFRQHGNRPCPATRHHSASAIAVIPLECPVNDEARIAHFQEVALPYLDDAYNLARCSTQEGCRTMKRRRFTEEQLIAILKEQEAGSIQEGQQV